MKLAGKIILLFIIAIIIETAVSSYFASHQFFEGVENRHRAIAKLLAKLEKEENFQKAMQAGDHAYFQKVVQTVTDYSTTIRWVDFEKTADSKYRPSMIDEKITRTQKVTTITGHSNAGDRMMLTYYPYKSNYEIDGIEITSSLKAADDQMVDTWKMALLSIAAMSLFSAGLVIVVGVRWIGRPLDALADKMERVGKGDYRSDFEHRSNDELGRLAVAVNQMCDQLSEQKGAIERETNQRIQTMEQLRHADRLKTVGQLAAGFAHEVGTPLNVVAGRASMMIANSNMEPEKIKENAVAIKTEAERISSIVQKLLDFARRGESKILIGDLREVVKHAVDLIRPLSLKRNIDIRTDLPADAAETGFDFHQMQQVLMNLIDNAVDASSDGNPVDVRLNRSDDGNKWRLEIEDRGHGIDVANHDQVFEPFFTTKEIGSGTGLGLSIVHGIVEEHGGRIWFNCEEKRDDLLRRAACGVGELVPTP